MKSGRALVVDVSKPGVRPLLGCFTKSPWKLRRLNGGLSLHPFFKIDLRIWILLKKQGIDLPDILIKE